MKVAARQDGLLVEANGKGYHSTFTLSIPLEREDALATGGALKEARYYGGIPETVGALLIERRSYDVIRTWPASRLAPTRLWLRPSGYK